METIYQSKIARKQRFMDEIQYDELHKAAEEIARMWSGLRVSLNRDPKKDSEP